MKTTVEISDTLYERARATAAREKTTLRALVEDGLRRTLAERERPANFKLREASFGGQGLQPGVQAGSWEHIRELIYEGRGG